MLCRSLLASRDGQRESGLKCNRKGGMQSVSECVCVCVLENEREAEQEQKITVPVWLVKLNSSEPSGAEFEPTGDNFRDSHYQHVRKFTVRFEWQRHLDDNHLKMQGRGTGKCFLLALNLIQRPSKENSLGYLTLCISKCQSWLITGINIKEKKLNILFVGNNEIPLGSVTESMNNNRLTIEGHFNICMNL